MWHVLVVSLAHQPNTYLLLILISHRLGSIGLSGGLRKVIMDIMWCCCRRGIAAELGKPECDRRWYNTALAGPRITGIPSQALSA